MTRRPARALYWCAGANRKYLKSPTERAWYQAIGLSVILTALVSMVSMTFALSLSLNGPWWVYTPFSVIWGLFVFNMDRWLVSTIHYGELDGTNPDGKAPVTAGLVVGYLARFLFAAVLAVVIAEPIVLQIFDAEISEQVEKNQKAAITAAALAVRAQPDIVAERTRITTRKTAADTELKNARAAQKIANDALDAELNGTGGSGEAGCGPRCAERRKDVKAANTRVTTAVKDSATVTADTGTDSRALESKIKILVDEQARTITGGAGLLARERALTELMRAHPELATRRWFVSVLFLVIDLVPLLLKTFGPTSNHDRDLRKTAAAHAQLHDMAHWTQQQRIRMKLDEELAGLKRERALHRAGLVHEVLMLKERMAYERQKLAAELEHERLLARMKPTAAFASGGMPGSTATLPDRVSAPGPGIHPTPRPPRQPQSPPQAQPQSQSQPQPQPPWSFPGSQAPSNATIVGGRWIVGPPLAGGGFGLTFQATDVNDPALHAVLKRIRPDNSNPEEHERALRYLRREQELQAKVDSPFVAPLLDAGDDPQFGPYIATPHYKLGTVRHCLRQDGFVPTLEWALRIAAQIIAGLVDCHDQASLIHLDIKPTNVALDADGNVKLIDFGLARTLDFLDGPSSVVPAFSLWYAAPEQIRKRLFSNWKTSAADVRAVAAVVYDIISGEPPLRREAEAAGIDLSDGDALINVIELVCDRNTRPERLDQLVPGVPSYVADLIDRWLSYDPTARASGPRKFAVHNAAEELLRVQARVTAEGLDSVPVGVAVAATVGPATVGPATVGPPPEALPRRAVVRSDRRVPQSRHAADDTADTLFEGPDSVRRTGSGGYFDGPTEG